MKLYIPEIGDAILLTKDWNFPLYSERRNSDFIEAMKGIYPNIEKVLEAKWEKHWKLLREWRDNPNSDYDTYPNDSTVNFPVQLVSGTVLKIDRIYIRKGADDYSSVTFQLVSSPNLALMHKKDGGTLPKGCKRRFWAKLPDVNTIEYEHA
jgi:hypothetical protein